MSDASTPETAETELSEAEEQQFFERLTDYPEAWMATFDHALRKAGEIALILEVGDGFVSFYLFRAPGHETLWDNVMLWVEEEARWHSEPAQRVFQKEIAEALSCCGNTGAYYLKLAYPDAPALADQAGRTFFTMIGKLSLILPSMARLDRS